MSRTGGASDIVKKERKKSKEKRKKKESEKKEDHRAGLVSNLPHPRVNKTNNSHTVPGSVTGTAPG